MENIGYKHEATAQEECVREGRQQTGHRVRSRIGKARGGGGERGERERKHTRGTGKPRSAAMVRTSAMPPRRRAGRLPTQAMSPPPPLVLPIHACAVAVVVDDDAGGVVARQKIALQEKCDVV